MSPLENWHCKVELAQEIKHIEDRVLRRELNDILAKAPTISKKTTTSRTW